MQSEPILRIALAGPLRTLFDYLPEGGGSPLPAVGTRVQVPFGRSGRTGLVADIESHSEVPGKQLKRISKALDEAALFSDQDLRLLKWAADYYQHPLGDVMMQALPALAEQDCERFGRAVGRLQQVVGDHFAPAQSGRYASPRVAHVLDWLAEQNIHGTGQSSWGPTGFAILESQSYAEAVMQAAIERFGVNPGLRFMISRARNHGSRIEVFGKTELRNPLRVVI